MYRDQIRQAYDGLSPSFQVLAKFLLDHTYEAAFMNASQLAVHLDVDPATVVRFAQRLGYPGFPELLGEIRSEVQDDLQRYTQPSEFTADPASVALAALRREINNLELMERSLKPREVNTFVEKVANANRVVVAAEGNGGAIGQLFAQQLNSMGINAHAISPSPAAVAAAVSALTDADVMIGIAETSICQDVAHALRLARERKVFTVGIAGSTTWPVATAAEMLMTAPNTSAIRTPDFPALMTLLSTLYQALWVATQEQQLAREKSYRAMLRSFTRLRNEEPQPEVPSRMTDRPPQTNGLGLGV